MALSGAQVEALAAIKARQSKRGWIAAADLNVARKHVAALQEQGLIEGADVENRRLTGSVRLTPEGHDVLAFRESRRASRHGTSEPPPRTRAVELAPAEFAAVRHFVAIADRLRKPPAEGFAEAVLTARHVPERSRHVLHLTRAQTKSLAYAMHLEGLALSRSGTHRLIHEYGLRYKPLPE
ncbi:hypothetical protein ACFVW2_04395 [Streptomyces sp. NPDC058171]